MVARLDCHGAGTNKSVKPADKPDFVRNGFLAVAAP